MAVLLYASAALRVIIAILVAVKLTWRFKHLACLERVGLALLGGSSLLTSAPMLFHHATPYDWASLTFGLGVILYLLGKLIREWKHDIG